MLDERERAALSVENTTVVESAGGEPLRVLSGTQELVPTIASGSLPSPVSTDPGKATLESVLLSDELTRAHAFSGVIALIATGTFLAVPMFEGDPDAKRAYAVCVAVDAVHSFWVWRSTRTERPYPRSMLRVYMGVVAVSTFFILDYVGVFSPVVAMLTLAIYYVGQSIDPVQALAAPVCMIGIYVTLALLMTLGVVSDRGLFSAADAPLSSHVFGIVAGAGVLLLTLFLARMSRASMRAAVERSIDEMRMAQRREALLAEAQQHLERALEVAIGKPGHSTGRRAGTYVLDVVIGVGAMGEIYAARDVETGETAAVKLLQAEAEQRADLVERFLREGRILKELESPHLVRVYAVGRLESGAPYMAMELLQGQDLAALLRKDVCLPLAAVVELAHALAEGLEKAHEARVIHRDLKPSNVFRCSSPDKRPVWKILDFGISKLQSAQETLTHHRIVGTPSYMSPEQARGLPIDHRSDIFSMALVLYRALTGRPAFMGTDTPQVLFEVVYKTPERPSAIIKELPPEVDLVLAIALAKNPADRYQSAREFALALDYAARRKLNTPLKARAHAILKAHPWREDARAEDPVVGQGPSVPRQPHLPNP